MQPDLGELLAHTDCHCPRFFRQLACKHDVVDLNERIEVSRGRCVVRGNQGDSVATCRLFHRGACVGRKRRGIHDNSLLNRGFQAARKRKTPDREH